MQIQHVHHLVRKKNTKGRKERMDRRQTNDEQEESMKTKKMPRKCSEEPHQENMGGLGRQRSTRKQESHRTEKNV